MNEKTIVVFCPICQSDTYIYEGEIYLCPDCGYEFDYDEIIRDEEL